MNSPAQKTARELVIKDMRMGRGRGNQPWTYKDLAEASKLAPSTIWSICAGKQPITLDSASKLCKVLRSGAEILRSVKQEEDEKAKENQQKKEEEKRYEKERSSEPEKPTPLPNGPLKPTQYLDFLTLAWDLRHAQEVPWTQRDLASALDMPEATLSARLNPDRTRRSPFRDEELDELGRVIQEALEKREEEQILQGEDKMKAIREWLTFMRTYDKESVPLKRQELLAEELRRRMMKPENVLHLREQGLLDALKSPWAQAIIEATRSPALPADPASLAPLLSQAPIDLDDLQKTIDGLIAAGLIRKDHSTLKPPSEQDVLRVSPSPPNEPETVREVRKIASRKALKEMLGHAQVALDQFTPKERYFRAGTVLVPEERVTNLFKMIGDVHEQIVAFAREPNRVGEDGERHESGAPRRRVYHIQIQAFPGTDWLPAHAPSPAEEEK